MRWSMVLLCVLACDSREAPVSRAPGTNSAASPKHVVPVSTDVPDATVAPSHRASAEVSMSASASASATEPAPPWGPFIPGVVRRLPHSAEPRIALTFDACGGPGGDGYDDVLIDLLKREKVPATLFLTRRWIIEHPDVAARLAAEPLFELQNHGARHLPCTVRGLRAFGIKGPEDERGARAEIAGGASAIAKLTGTSPRFYRPGTGYFEPACVEVVHASGARPLGFTVAGDAGGSFARARIARAVGEAPPGAIVLLHMNQPNHEIADAVRDALPRLRARRVVLVRLTEAFSFPRKGDSRQVGGKPTFDGNAGRQTE